MAEDSREGIGQVDITVYVLDCARGLPADGVPVTLERLVDRDWRELARWVTDDDGLIIESLFTSSHRGIHRVSLDVDSYFVGLGLEPFYPIINVIFRVTDPARSLHIPVLVSPYSFSSYSTIHRGPAVVIELDRP